MNSRMRSYWTWTLPGLASLGALGWAITALGQNPKSGNDLAKAKEMAEMVQKGQCSLREATTIAEEHVKGTALAATCEVEAGAPTPNAPGSKPGAGELQSGQQEPPKPGTPAAPKADEKRLVYAISCFNHNKIEVVRVDGKAKSVLDVKEQRSLAGDE